MIRVTLSGLFVLMLLAVHPAYGQEPLVRVAGGVATTSDGSTSLQGGVASLDYLISRRLSIVGTVHRTTGSSEGYFSTWSWSDIFAGGGVRFSGRRWPRVEPFALALVGGLRTAGVERPDRNPPRGFRFVDRSYSETVATVVAGGGLALYPVPRVGVRAGVDWQFFFEDTLPQGRVTAELVVGIGTRQNAAQEAARRRESSADLAFNLTGRALFWFFGPSFMKPALASIMRNPLRACASCSSTTTMQATKLS